MAEIQLKKFDISQIKDDKVVWPELNKIWTKVSGKDSFTPSDEWLNNFIAQNKTLLNKVNIIIFT